MSEKLPEAIGPYRIQAKLGQGGMGAVFKAVHDTLERPAAVKLLPPELAQNPEYVSRFLREARTVATLNNPNIVQVYDAGAFEGKYFIAMELVEGQSLADYLDAKGKLSEEEGLRLLQQAAQGLSVAHAKGLVHRDIKPENMLLDKDLNLKIVDFGLVMETASQTQLTATGACLGTPMYMSPEQTDGEKADARSDIYSLGVTFYRALVGTPPFTSPTVMNLLFKHRFEAPPDPRSMRPELSANICNLLLTMMAKPREDRPQDGQSLVKLIEQMQQGRAIPAAPPFRSPLTSSGMPAQSGSGLQPGVGRPDRSNKTLLIGLAAAAAVILMVSGLALWILVWKGTPARQTANTKSTTTTPPDTKTSTSNGQTTTDGQTSANERQQLLERARKLEEGGDLALAVALYERSVGMEADEALTAKIRSLKDQMKEPPPAEPVPVEKKTPVPQPPARDPGLDLAKDAQQLAAQGDFALAAVKYEEAAQLSKQADLKKAYTNRARDCRREAYLKEADTLDAKRDWAGAAALLSRALELTPDPAVQLRRDALLKKAKDDSEFRGYMQAGDAALAKNEFVPARVNYQLALRIDQSSSEAKLKLNEANGRLALQNGDLARDKGDLNTAKLEYLRAQELCPGLKTDADQRLVTMSQQQVSAERVGADIDRLVREGRSNDAFTTLANSIRANPTDAQLLRLKEGLESLQACENIYRSLKPILQQGQTAALDARALDIEDDQALRLKESLEGKAFQCDTRSAQARTHFLSRANEPLRAMVTEAKTTALTAGGELEGAAERYRRKATEAADFKGVNVGFVRIGSKGDKQKADRYNRVADSFATLGRQARALSQ